MDRCEDPGAFAEPSPAGGITAAASRNDLAWWQKAAFYQIAPVSFLDTDGDGRGDLAGVIDRIDYLTWLGVGAIWLCPIYPSPFRDFGYDISDFCNIDPAYGTLAEFDRLVTELHARDLKLLLDFVPNHTSDSHPWFGESRSSRRNPKRDWFVWRDPAPDGGPPNNWLSRFGGSAWEWDGDTGQYYYHAFLREQPDLNWRNPDVRAAMADVMRFWLRRGVDGFRIDAAAVLAEDELLRDDPPRPGYDPQKSPPPERLQRVFTDDRPESMAYLAELRKVVAEFPHRILAGEIQGKLDRIGSFYGSSAEPCLHLPLNYALMDTPWDAHSLQGTIDRYLGAVPSHGWPDWVLGGHDKKRLAQRIGQSRSRLAVLLAMTLPGTPFFFAGDEIGMPSVDISGRDPDDPFEKLVPGYGLNRDPERSPMRWTSEPHGGFTRGRPWLPMGDDVAERNVQKLRDDRHSILWLYRGLIGLRASERALTGGRYVPKRSINDVLYFERAVGGEVVMVALNLSEEPRKLVAGDGTLLISTRLDCNGASVSAGDILRGHEGIVVKLADTK
jgi:alpha-glucosidase